MRAALVTVLLALTACEGHPRTGGITLPRGDGGVVDTGVACVPSCNDKECGDDGCNGSCGTCPLAAPFCVAARCATECTPNCADRECGDDGCNGSCGTCPQAAPNCVDHMCSVQCTPNCAGRTCGDDGCNGSCGTCSSGTCVGGNCEVAGGCTASTSRCVDGFAYEVCGFESVASVDRTYGPRVPCWEPNTCTSGECGSECGVPEVLLIVDRSSSMQGARWEFVRQAIIDFTRANQNRVRFGLRMFPSGGGCAVGNVVPIDIDNAFSIETNLDDPSADSQTPIAAALENLSSNFGDPNQGQAAVLITDGDETCAADSSDASIQTEVLARSGIRTFAIGISTMANPSLLANIAAAGRTASPYLANDGPALEAALDSVIDALDVCEVVVGPGIGDPCLVATDCTGGLCLTNELVVWPDGYCSQVCNPTMCPNGSTCFVGPQPNASVCLENCGSVSDCRSGYSCVDPFGGSNTVCIPGG